MEKIIYGKDSYTIINVLTSDNITYFAAKKDQPLNPSVSQSDSKFKFSSRSLDNLKNIHPDLVKVITESLRNSPYDFTVTSGARTTAQQNALYQQGRTKPGIKVTNADGYKSKSNHQLKKDNKTGLEYGFAVDLYPIIDGKLRAENGDYEKYKKQWNEVKDNILETARKLGINITWGGTFKNMFDPPHYELKNI